MPQQQPQPQQHNRRKASVVDGDADTDTAEARALIAQPGGVAEALAAALVGGGLRGPFALPQPEEPPGVEGKKQGELRSVIIQAAGRMQLTGWGRHGSVTGFTEVVPYYRLWVNPLYPVHYSDEEIGSLAVAMLHDNQRDPLVVTPALDTRTPADGGTGGDLLIIKGVRRYKAAPRAGLSEMMVQVLPYANFYDATFDAVTRKLSQSEHVLDDLEAGLLILSTRVAYNLTRQQQPTLKPFPTQEELGKHFGRSQGTISKWLRLAQLPDDVMERLLSGQLTHAQGEALLHATPAVQREAAAVLVEENAAREQPVPRAEARRIVSQKRGTDRAAPTWAIPVQPAPTERLWLGEALDGQQLPVAIGVLAHDLAACLEAAAADMQRLPHPAFAALRRALASPEVQRHIHSIREGDEGDEGDH